MKKTNFKFWLINALKVSVAINIADKLGSWFYMLFLNQWNIDAPESARFRTVIFSMLVFSFSIGLTYQFAMWHTDDTRKSDEGNILANAYKESNYTLDYKEYFSQQVKKSLWSYYLIPLLTQFPVFVNYLVVTVLDYESVYSCPVDIYKHSMTSVFAYELLGKLWYIGPIVYVVLFSIIITYLIYRGQKKWMVKPSYLK